MEPDTESDVDTESEVNELADSLEEGQQVLFNDRSVPLIVAKRQKKQISKNYRKRLGREYYDIVVLEGNGTNYHLVWQHGSGTEPILRKESQWDETENDDGSVEYEYSHAGDRVTDLEIIQ